MDRYASAQTAGEKTEALARLTSKSQLEYFTLMSATEILKELPKLTESERRAVRQVLLDLANQNEDVAASNQSALDGALMLDEMENKDARSQSR
jgi:hypothetical protein